jgi:hypothetical protein
MRTVYNRGFRSVGAPELAEQLARAGITLPADVADALATRLRVRDLRAARTTSQDAKAGLVRRIVEDADVTVDDITADAGKIIAADLVADAITAAEEEAQIAVRNALDVHSDAIVIQIREQMFDPAAEILAKVAERTLPADTAGTLVAAGRTADAKLTANAPVAHGQIAHALTLRRQVYRRSGIDQMRHHLWRNPRTVRAPDDAVGLDYFLAGLRSGGELWFGTYTEVQAADDADRVAVQQQEREAVAALQADYARRQAARRNRRANNGPEAA